MNVQQLGHLHDILGTAVRTVALRQVRDTPGSAVLDHVVVRDLVCGRPRGRENQTAYAARTGAVLQKPVELI